MERILTEGRTVRESFQEMILQPQSDIPHFRRFLKMEGWRIQEERIIREDGKFYPMMKAVHGEKENFLPGTPYTLSEWFGGMLLERRDPVLGEYLKRELRIRDRILEKLQNAPDPGQRLEEVREEKRMILTALEKYESI